MCTCREGEKEREMHTTSRLQIRLLEWPPDGLATCNYRSTSGPLPPIKPGAQLAPMTLAGHKRWQAPSSLHSKQLVQARGNNLAAKKSAERTGRRAMAAMAMVPGVGS